MPEQLRVETEESYPMMAKGDRAYIQMKERYVLCRSPWIGDGD
jgi:hypothetical protein